MMVVMLKDGRVNSYQGGGYFCVSLVGKGMVGVLSVRTAHVNLLVSYSIRVGIIAGFAQSRLDWIGCHLFRLCPVRFGIAWRGTVLR